jgi:hypothetical protein
MGVAGLLPLLKPVTKSNHVSAYRDRSIAIDGKNDSYCSTRFEAV